MHFGIGVEYLRGCMLLKAYIQIIAMVGIQISKMEGTKESEQKAKVIVITGFLGAGKTTLIESVLKQPILNQKVAVIQNEFSAKMGLESALMKDQDGNDIDDFYEMPNGCICCGAKDDLILTLDTLLEKKPELEYILVETNGLADPSQVIQTFWVDDGLCSKITLHQTIGVIDTHHYFNLIKFKFKQYNFKIIMLVLNCQL